MDNWYLGKYQMSKRYNYVDDLPNVVPELIFKEPTIQFDEILQCSASILLAEKLCELHYNNFFRKMKSDYHYRISFTLLGDPVDVM